MVALRLQINDTTIYEGSPGAVPRAGDDIHHGAEVVRVEAVVWDFSGEDVVSVTLVVGDRPYTF